MTLLVAFLAGLVSCISPCVLPVMPVYAGYVAGAVPMGSTAVVGSSPSWRAIGFLFGFLGVFVLIWASIGVAGFALISAVPALRQVAGVLIVIMGIAMITGRQPMLMVPARFSGMARGGPVLLGAGVAVGWTPCIGPTLGAILTLAATGSTLGSGLALLLAYAIGLAVPFLIVLVALTRFRRWATVFARHHRAIEVVSGTLTAIVGLLVFSGAFARLAGLFTFGVV
jgi:cytochrome c-type biogenesis protein